MRKALPMALFISCLGIVLQLVVTLFIKNGSADYTIKTEDNVYAISENLEVRDHKSYYDIGITDVNGNYYSIYLNHNFNRQNEIIKDIKTYNSNGLSCIFPIYRRNMSANVSCLYNGELVSYSYLKQHNNVDLNNFVSQLQSEGYKYNAWNEKDLTTINLTEAGRGIDVYQNNINTLHEYTFLMWRYKGLYVLQRNSSLASDYLKNDVYDNSLSRLAGRNYITPIVDSATGRLSEMYYFDVRELLKGSIMFPEQISSNFYFNGVYDDYLYMTDLNSRKQYMVDVGLEKLAPVGFEQKGYSVVENNELKTVDANTFFANKVYFEYPVQNNEIMTTYGVGEVTQEGNYYYFSTVDGRFYRAHINNPTKAELLFKFNGISTWKVRNGEIILITGNMLYFYNDKEGLVPIAKNNELSYNYNNIVEFWKE